MIGHVVRKYRQLDGIDQEDLAAVLRVSQSQMSRIESGHVPMTKDQLFALADHFDAPELLLEYIQPYLDHALEMSGTMPQPPEKHLIDLMTDSLQQIRIALDVSDTQQVDAAAARLIALAQVVRILTDR